MKTNYSDFFTFHLSLLACLLLTLSGNLNAQSVGSQTHVFAMVYDSVYGIQFYDKYNPTLEGDSIRKYSDGHLCNSLIEDHYPNKQILHKGFYTNGKLTQYTNYYCCAIIIVNHQTW